MLLSMSQMASFHGLKDGNLSLEISNRQLKRVSETRLLGSEVSHRTQNGMIMSRSSLMLLMHSYA